jgi:hypothetical protein
MMPCGVIHFFNFTQLSVIERETVFIHAAPNADVLYVLSHNFSIDTDTNAENSSLILLPSEATTYLHAPT